MSCIVFCQANVATRHDTVNSFSQANVATQHNIATFFAPRAARAVTHSLSVQRCDCRERAREMARERARVGEREGEREAH